MTVRWPTGLKNPVRRPRVHEPVEQAERRGRLAPVLPGRREVEPGAWAEAYPPQQPITAHGSANGQPSSAIQPT